MRYGSVSSSAIYRVCSFGMGRLVVSYVSYGRRCRRLWKNNKFDSRALSCQSSKRYFCTSPSYYYEDMFSCRFSYQTSSSSSRYLSTSSSCNQSRDDVSSTSSQQMYEVCEQTVLSSTSSNSKTTRKGRVLYRPTANGWERITTPISTTSTTSLSSLFNSYKDKDMTNIQSLPFIHHFLPARYPYSVCPSYGRYASYCFMGSVAGSSGKFALV